MTDLTSLAAVGDDNEFRKELRADIPPSAWPDWIQLSAHRETHRTDRLKRLAMVVGIVRPEVAAKIARLHDRKGQLSCVFAETPAADECHFIRSAWALFDSGPVGFYIPVLTNDDDGPFGISPEGVTFAYP